MKYLTAIAAAKRLNVSDKTVRRWIEEGKLSAHHPRPNQLAIPEQEIDALAREREQYQDQDITETQPDTSVLLARIEALESRVQELETRDHLATIALGPSSESLTSDRTRARTRRPTTTTGPYSDMTALEGETVHYRDFAERHGVKLATFRDHITKGIQGDRVPATEVPINARPGQTEKRLTLEQQRQAISFWQRHGVAFIMPEDQSKQQSQEGLWPSGEGNL